MNKLILCEGKTDAILQKSRRDNGRERYYCGSHHNNEMGWSQATLAARLCNLTGDYRRTILW